ncbi:MAG: hypothetical protein GY803_17550, partial [Chloroflexi bacterium]|nr:hypothetical protein [Chloroflexota bacterium]
LSAIAANFTSTAGSIVVTQAISGMGGVGKTQVALAYAHTQRDKYDINWLLHADDTPTLDNGLRQLGETLELDIAGKDAPTQRSIVLSHLSSSKKEVLLLYDNADQIAPRDLRPYLPSGCHLLITSRRDDSQWSETARTLTLGTFTEAEAEAFWRKRLDSTAEVGLLSKARLLDREELAEALGRLPLAMEQAAAFMQTPPKMTASVYTEKFKTERDRLWEREKAPDRYHATVATTWKMAFDHAKETTGAADLLNLCCFFAPEEIPLAVIQAEAGSLPDGLAAVVVDEWLLGDALKALSNYSLLMVADGKLNIHRLVQVVARQQMGQNGRRSGCRLR